MKHLLAVLATALVLGTTPAEAAAYIKFDGIDGEVQEKDHKNWINLTSVSSTITRAGGTPNEPGRVVLREFTCACRAGKSTPKLAEAVAKGDFFASVVLSFPIVAAEGGRVSYLRYELENVRITSYSISGAGASADVVPTDSFSLNFERIKIVHVDEAGTPTAGSIVLSSAN